MDAIVDAASNRGLKGGACGAAVGLTVMTVVGFAAGFIMRRGYEASKTTSTLVGLGSAVFIPPIVLAFFCCTVGGCAVAGAGAGIGSTILFSNEEE